MSWLLYNRLQTALTENNLEHECIATDGDEHGDAEEHGPHALHQTPATVPGGPHYGLSALIVNVTSIVLRIHPAAKHLKGSSR